VCAGGCGPGTVHLINGLFDANRSRVPVLADRNFAAAALITAIGHTGADVLARVKNGHKLPALARYRDGSYLSPDGARIRVIEAQITIATSTGRRTGTNRLVTSLLDDRACPAAELIMLYHQRREIETATWN
jgi:hypothetical protein